MTNTFFATDGKAGVDIATPSSVAGFNLGEKVHCNDGTIFHYAKAISAISQNYWVGIDEAHNASLLTKGIADDGWNIGVAPTTFAANDYGWFTMVGTHNGRVAASCAADVPLYTTAVAGVLDDASTGQTKIDGVVAVTAVTAAAATECILTYPRASTF